MKLRRRQPNPPQETIITLIDGVFFLLVFFMLIGRLDATAPFETAPPMAVSGTDMPGGGATLAVAQDGELALDGRAVTSDQAMSALANELAARPDRLIRINAHKDAELRHIMPLVVALEESGATNVVLVVTPESAP